MIEELIIQEKELIEEEKENIKVVEVTKEVIFWKTKDGRKIPLEDLEDDHLQKTLIIVQRREYRDWKKIQVHIDLRDGIEEEAERRS